MYRWGEGGRQPFFLPFSSATPLQDLLFLFPPFPPLFSAEIPLISRGRRRQHPPSSIPPFKPCRRILFPLNPLSTLSSSLKKSNRSRTRTRYDWKRISNRCVANSRWRIPLLGSWMRGVVILFFFLSPPFPLERRCYTLTLRAAAEEEEEEGGGALSSPFPPFLFPLGNHAKGGRWDQRPLPLPLLPPLFFGVGGGEARPPTPPTTMIYAREEWRRFTYGKDPPTLAALH